MAQTVKNLPAMQETQVRSLGWDDPLEKEMTTTPVFLPGESHGQRSQAGYCPGGGKVSDTTEQLSSSMNEYHAPRLKSIQDSLATESMVQR